jgi:hypothetical protein
MLNLRGKTTSTCEGLTRRHLLKAGFLGLGGLTLPQLLRLRAEAAEAGSPLPKTSVIFIELAGGPTHFETYDPKPYAPAEYRGPLGVVQTNIPGVILSELMVEQAKIMDKLAIIRSIHHDSGSHGTSSHLVQTGYYLRDRQNRENEMPCVGSFTAHLRGPNQVGLPAFVSIPGQMRYGGAAYLGKGYNAFTTGGDPNSANFKVKNLTPAQGLTVAQLEDRRQLLASLESTRQLADTRGVASAIDKFTGDAFQLVTGDRARSAFDLTQESSQVRDRYGRHTTGQSLLLARRLIEAGVTFVTVRPSGGSWDDHNQIAQRMKQKGPAYDQGVAALVNDLHERGLNRDVLVVAIGEFGRTPRVNGNAGRDHWGRVMSVLMAGGGLRVGQIVGASNSKGEVPADNPYRPESVLAMVYEHLGIDASVRVPDFTGLPRYILSNRKRIEELL